MDVVAGVGIKDNLGDHRWAAGAAKFAVMRLDNPDVVRQSR
jgi:hypothetical protein